MRTFSPILIVICLAGIGPRALAFTPGACREDAARLCPGSTDESMTPCLKKYEAQLSTACRVNLAEGRHMVRSLMETCASDLKKFCADVKQGGGRIRRCLKEHEAELSTDCKEQLAAARQKLQTGTSTPPQ